MVFAIPARVVSCRPVRSSAFFTNAHREPLNAVAAWRSPAERSWFQVCRRTSSNAFVAQATMWKGSRQSAAFGARALTTEWIHSAPSAVTCVNWEDLSSPSRSKNPLRVSLFRPGAARTNRPVS